MPSVSPRERFAAKPKGFRTFGKAVARVRALPDGKAPPGARRCASTPGPKFGDRDRSNSMKTILIATDGSEPAGQALDVAIDLARQTGATLQVLSVRPQRPAGRAGAGPAMLEVEELDGPEHIAEAAALAGSRGRRRGHAALRSRRRRDRHLRRRDLAARRLARGRITRARSALRCRARQRLARACEPFAGAGDDRSPGGRARHRRRLSLAAVRRPW